VKTDAELIAAGFTDSGITRYRNTANGFCDELFIKAVALGDRDKAVDAPREVTHEHVRDAAAKLAERGRKGQSSLQIWCQIGEYVFTATAGVGAAKLDQSWGIILFGGSVALGVILFVVRNTQKR
jgi:hypothetical protein